MNTRKVKIRSIPKKLNSILKLICIILLSLGMVGCSTVNSVKNDATSISSIEETQFEITIVAKDSTNTTVSNLTVQAYDSNDTLLTTQTSNESGQLTLSFTLSDRSNPIYLKTDQSSDQQYQIELNASSFSYSLQL